MNHTFRSLRRSADFQRFKLEALTGFLGILAGASMGLFAGIPGAIAGASVGYLTGILLGSFLSKRSDERSFHDAELDQDFRSTVPGVHLSHEVPLGRQRLYLP